MGTSLLKNKLKHSYSEKGQAILCIYKKKKNTEKI